MTEVNADKAWKTYVGGFDTYSSEWQDKGCDEVFKAGFSAAQNAASDLEIVQKALTAVGRYGGILIFQDDGSCCITRYPAVDLSNSVHAFANISDLMAWAKQQLGE